MLKKLKNIGPGTIIAAAFIGPGTVTVCTLSGVQYGFTLLWAVFISMIATIVLQEMAARLGLISGKGLTENIIKSIPNPIFKFLAIAIVLLAVLLGNAAYEAGNISGGVLGLANIISATSFSLGTFEFNIWPIIIGLLAFIVLYFGSYKTIEKSLVTIVLLMSLMFVLAAILTTPNIGELLKGLFLPVVPEKGWLSVIAIVGTTVVPYNIFLHASLVGEKWKEEKDLKAMRTDTYIAVILGGIVSMAIIVAAAAVKQTEVQNTGDLAKGLEPLLGQWAPICIGVGLFAAGISSAITAPLAAGYVMKGLTQKKRYFQWTWMTILFIGIIVASVGFQPIHVIQVAQFSNGLLLPVIAIFLIFVCNQKQILGKYSNNALQNGFAILILLIAILLGTKSILSVFDLI